MVVLPGRLSRLEATGCAPSTVVMIAVSCYEFNEYLNTRLPRKDDLFFAVVAEKPAILNQNRPPMGFIF